LVKRNAVKILDFVWSETVFPQRAENLILTSSLLPTSYLLLTTYLERSGPKWLKALRSGIREPAARSALFDRWIRVVQLIAAVDSAAHRNHAISIEIVRFRPHHLTRSVENDARARSCNDL
jgi:hypothetical protein